MSLKGTAEGGASRARWPRSWLCVVLATVIGSAVVYWAFFMRERRSWDEVVLFGDGSSVFVHREYSQRAYHGHPHLIDWGGGDVRNLLTFTFQGVDYAWRGPYIPIVLDQFDECLYIAAFDRETDFSRIRFRLYRAVGAQEYAEVAPSEFPKNVGQNMWLDTEAREVLDAMVPSDSRFRNSLTAKLWSFLADPTKFQYGDEVNEAFLRDYKDRWVATANEAPP